MGAQACEGRYAHLLQPIRDLAKNWNINLANDLEEYLEELDGMTFSFAGDAADTMNFSEAALLIQGSACVYSKKVEYLSMMTMKAIEFIKNKKTSQQEKQANKKRSKNEASAQEDEHSFFDIELTIRGGTDIDLIPERTLEKPTLVCPPPVLLALEDPVWQIQGDSDGANLRLNKCFVHSSGALLLEPRIGDLYNEQLRKVARPEESFQFDHHGPCSLPTPTRIGGAADDAFVGGSPPSNTGESIVDAPDVDMGEGRWNDDAGEGGDVGMSPGLGNEPSLHGSTGEVDGRVGAEPERTPHSHPEHNDASASPSCSEYFDPYKALDFQDRGSLPIRPARRRIPKKKRFSADVGTSASDALRAPANGLAFREFAYILKTVAASRNGESAPQSRTQSLLGWENGALAPVQQDDNNLLERNDGDIDGWDTGANPLGVGEDSASDGDGDDGPPGDAFGFGDCGPPWPAECNQPEDDLDVDNGESGYLELCRQHSERHAAAVVGAAAQTELAARVADWTERVGPLLEAEKSKPQFDLHTYQQRILDDLAASCKDKGPEDELDPVPLRNILSQEEGREVSRLFAAMLQLVNDQNVRVVVGDTGTGNAAALQILNLKMRAAQLGDDCSMEDEAHEGCPLEDELATVEEHRAKKPAAAKQARQKCPSKKTKR